VASGGTYGSQPDQSTLTITECLSSGCYDFTISDAYGDGICCSYGNGSYSVTGDGSTLASGSSFTSSATTNFCVGSSPPASCDTPTGLGTTGVTDVDATLIWSAVSGASSYNVEIFTGGLALLVLRRVQHILSQYKLIVKMQLLQLLLLIASLLNLVVAVIQVVDAVMLRLIVKHLKVAGAFGMMVAAIRIETTTLIMLRVVRILSV